MSHVYAEMPALGASSTSSASMNGSHRRASAGLVQVLGNPFPNGYGSDEDDDDDAALVVQHQSHRRASFTGPIAHRRGSNGGSMAQPMNGYLSSDNVPHSAAATRRPSNSPSTNGGAIPRTYSHDGLPSMASSRGGRRPQNHPVGLNPDVVERMSSFRVQHDDDDDDDDEKAHSNTYGYDHYGGGGGNATDTSNPYGYKSTSQHGSISSSLHQIPSSSLAQRRPSAASSVRSRSSRVSRRRSSNGITALRASHLPDPLAAAGLYPRTRPRHRGPNNIYDSDPDDGEEPSENSEVEVPFVPPEKKQSSSFGYDSDMVSDSDQSQGSISSSKRLRRRNSCLVRPDSELGLLGAIAPNHRMSDRDLIGSDVGVLLTDEDDPDSLLNRAKKGSLHKKQAKAGPTKAVARDNQEATDAEDNAFLYEDNYGASTKKANRTIGADPMPTNTAIAPSKDATAALRASVVSTTTAPDVTVVNSEAPSKPSTTVAQRPESTWRKSNFTVPYAAPTAENLRMSMMNMLTSTDHEPTAPQPNGNGIPGWGEMDINDGSSNPESSGPIKSDSEQSYGASMYTKPQVQQEIDSFQQKARRRASLENTCVDIDNYVNGATQVKNVKVPNFKPAEGCRNASDFVVRCFSARMRISGFVVLKHNRSRWSKAKNREIFLLPDCKTLTWREIDLDKESNGVGAPGPGGASTVGGGTTVKSKDKTRRPKIDLSTCIEIRHAWSADPTTKNKTGTSILRSRCKEALASKSFSLIFAKRTLDFTAFSNDQCKVLMEGFSALCFRLQLKALEDRNSDDQSSRLHLSEDDWVSTVYGESTAESASLSNTNSSIPAAVTPWGC